jgi:antitoxin component HigA of HigAB toxin-antitoxin module
MVDLKDSIQVHLLTETALSDSKEYEILSQEELDDLKKQCQALTQRIDSTRANLLIQAKYRDAANSMARLYSPTSAEGNRRSWLGGAANEDPEAEQERLDCERKCEQLAAELFQLEKKLMEPQRRILEHTAGILQLTHGTSKKKAIGPNGQPLNGIPGSPESLYTYSQGRNSLDAFGDEYYTDDTSLDELDALMGRKPNTQLLDSIAEMEKKLKTLNLSLRETIIRFNPAENGSFQPPPSAVQDAKPGDMLKSQLEYLEVGLAAVQTEQESFEGQSGGGTDKELAGLWDMMRTGFSDIRQRKEERRRARSDKGLEDDEDISEDDGFDLEEPYNIYEFSSRVRWLYKQATVLKDQKTVLKRQIKQQRELNNKSDAEKDAELADKQAQLDESHILVDRAEQDALNAQKMLSEALEDLEQARAGGSAVSALETELEESLLKIKDLQKQMGEKNEALQVKETEYEKLNESYVELKTEFTIARAELDGAYGTRAERAADVAAKQTNTEVSKLQEQVETLKSELSGTIKDLEDMTKETLGAEREKVDLESKLDEALSSRTALEADMAALRERLDGEIQKSREKIAALQEDLDGERLKAGRGDSSRPGAGASMLSEQFRATMREERKKFQDEIRVSTPGSGQHDLSHVYYEYPHDNEQTADNGHRKNARATASSRRSSHDSNERQAQARARSALGETIPRAPRTTIYEWCEGVDCTTSKRAPPATFFFTLFGLYHAHIYICITMHLGFGPSRLRAAYHGKRGKTCFLATEF